MTPINRTTKYLTPKDVSDQFQISEKTVRRMISSGALPAKRIGPRLIRIDSEDADRAMRRIPSATTGTSTPTGP